MKLYTILFYFIATFLIRCNYSYSQKSILISGIVLDRRTNEPIPFLSVIEQGSNKTTITNEIGEFEFKIETLPSNLSFSHISYEKSTIIVTEQKFYKIYLNEATIDLPEVSTGNRATLILKAAIARSERDSSEKIYSKFFYQKVAKGGNETNSVHEIFFDGGWSVFGLKLWNPTHARYAEKPSQYHFRNITAFVFNLSGVINKNKYLPNNINNVELNYKYTVDGHLNESSDNEIIIINCIPKSTNVSYFLGKIYIKPKYDNIVKIEGVYYPKDSERSFDLVSFKRNKIKMTINFGESTEKKVYFENAHFEYSLIMAYIGLGFRKFTENVNIISYESLTTNQNLKSSFVRSDLDLIKGVPYNEDFWKDNAVIKRGLILENDIKKFEKNKSFGNYFNKENNK